jgi:hypothetical protein
MHPQEAMSKTLERGGNHSRVSYQKEQNYMTSREFNKNSRWRKDIAGGKK